MNDQDSTYLLLRYGDISEYNFQERLEFLNTLSDQAIAHIYQNLFRNTYHHNRAEKISWILTMPQELHVNAIKHVLTEHLK